MQRIMLTINITRNRKIVLNYVEIDKRANKIFFVEMSHYDTEILHWHFGKSKLDV